MLITGGDGSSEENAIVIRNAKTTKDGVNTEYKVVAKHFGVEDIDWRPVEQYSISSDDTKRYYDIIHIKNRDGEHYAIWFDITSFYGKEMLFTITTFGTI